MNIVLIVINYLLPLFALTLLFIGLWKQLKRFVFTALLISLLAIVLQYEIAGGELLGTYFNYHNAVIYTLSFIILLTALSYLFIKNKRLQGKYIRYPAGILLVILIGASFIILINIWINASFIANKLPGTSIIQVATFHELNHCKNNYIFYKVDSTGKLLYLCPNHYGLIAKTGIVSARPELIIRQMTQHHTPNSFKKGSVNY